MKEEAERKAADAMHKKLLEQVKNDGVGETVIHILYHAAHAIAEITLGPPEDEFRTEGLFFNRKMTKAYVQISVGPGAFIVRGLA